MTDIESSNSQYFECNLKHHETVRIRPEMIEIGDSIWWSTDYDKGEQGMVEYNPLTDTIRNVIKYPLEIAPAYHSCCKHKNVIYIVDGRNGQIILFDPVGACFVMKLQIRKIGRRARCIVIADQIHIFNGYNNCKHFVYFITHNKIQILTDPTTNSSVTDICVLKYENKIIRFGGYDMDSSSFTSTLFISSAISGDISAIEWCGGWQLLRGVVGCGYITYKQYMIIFGGRSSYNEYMDAICVLNVESDTGWQQLKHIKCPVASQYVAVLSRDNNVHLLTAYNKHKMTTHYRIAMSDILRENDYAYEDEKYDEKDVMATTTRSSVSRARSEEKEKERSPMIQAKETEMSALLMKKRNLETKKRQKKKKKKQKRKRIQILESIAEFETENTEPLPLNHTQNKPKTQETKKRTESLDTKPHQPNALRQKDEAKEEEEEEIAIESLLLKRWHLARYISMLIDQMGYDDIEDWKDITENELMNDMRFKKGHAKRFIRNTKAYFTNIDSQNNAKQ
eukprot:413631_1